MKQVIVRIQQPEIRSFAGSTLPGLYDLYDRRNDQVSLEEVGRILI